MDMRRANFAESQRQQLTRGVFLVKQKDSCARPKNGKVTGAFIWREYRYTPYVNRPGITVGTVHVKQVYSLNRWCAEKAFEKKGRRCHGERSYFDTNLFWKRGVVVWLTTVHFGSWTEPAPTVRKTTIKMQKRRNKLTSVPNTKSIMFSRATPFLGRQSM